jgi:hypothetical protein
VTIFRSGCRARAFWQTSLPPCLPRRRVTDAVNGAVVTNRLVSRQGLFAVATAAVATAAAATNGASGRGGYACPDRGLGLALHHVQRTSLAPALRTVLAAGPPRAAVVAFDLAAHHSIQDFGNRGGGGVRVITGLTIPPGTSPRRPTILSDRSPRSLSGLRSSDISRASGPPPRRSAGCPRA